MQLSCPTCGHECAPRDEICPACHASLTVQVLMEEPDRSRAFAQLLEMRAEGDLADWSELEAYLAREIEQFGSFPRIEHLEGLASIEQGLRLLLEAVHAMQGGTDALTRAEEGEALLRRGREQLVEQPSDEEPAPSTE